MAHKRCRFFERVCIPQTLFLSNIDKIQIFFLLIIEIEASDKMCYHLLNWLSKWKHQIFLLFCLTG